jgi:hypothetical protein
VVFERGFAQIIGHRPVLPRPDLKAQICRVGAGFDKADMASIYKGLPCLPMQASVVNGAICGKAGIRPMYLGRPQIAKLFGWARAAMRFTAEADVVVSEEWSA